MLEHVAHDIGQVVLCDEFLPVAQFGDALRNLRHLLGRELQTEFLQVDFDICLSAVFSQCVFASPAKTLGHERVAV